MTDDYDKGLMQGRINALEKNVTDLTRELTEVVKTIKYMEKILWMLIGAGVFLQVWPAFQAIMSK